MIELSTDPTRIDADWVHTLLSEQAYWALGRTREAQDRANASSRCYGLYTADGAQVAFARVVTDDATFAWLCDVIVDPAHRGHGLGKRLVAGIVEDLEPLGLRRILLATADAHDLYRQHGWVPLHEPDRWMQRP